MNEIFRNLQYHVLKASSYEKFAQQKIKKADDLINQHSISFSESQLKLEVTFHSVADLIERWKNEFLQSLNKTAAEQNAQLVSRKMILESTLSDLKMAMNEVKEIDPNHIEFAPAQSYLRKIEEMVNYICGEQKEDSLDLAKFMVNENLSHMENRFGIGYIQTYPIDISTVTMEPETPRIIGCEATYLIKFPEVYDRERVLEECTWDVKVQNAHLPVKIFERVTKNEIRLRFDVRSSERHTVSFRVYHQHAVGSPSCFVPKRSRKLKLVKNESPDNANGLSHTELRHSSNAQRESSGMRECGPMLNGFTTDSFRKSNSMFDPKSSPTLGFNCSKNMSGDMFEKKLVFPKNSILSDSASNIENSDKSNFSTFNSIKNNKRPCQSSVDEEDHRVLYTKNGESRSIVNVKNSEASSASTGASNNVDHRARNEVDNNSVLMSKIVDLLQKITVDQGMKPVVETFVNNVLKNSPERLKSEIKNENGNEGEKWVAENLKVAKKKFKITPEKSERIDLLTDSPVHHIYTAEKPLMPIQTKNIGIKLEKSQEELSSSTTSTWGSPPVLTTSPEQVFLLSSNEQKSFVNNQNNFPNRKILSPKSLNVIANQKLMCPTNFGVSSYGGQNIASLNQEIVESANSHMLHSEYSKFMHSATGENVQITPVRQALKVELNSSHNDREHEMKTPTLASFNLNFMKSEAIHELKTPDTIHDLKTPDTFSEPLRDAKTPHHGSRNQNEIAAQPIFVQGMRTLEPIVKDHIVENEFQVPVRNRSRWPESESGSRSSSAARNQLSATNMLFAKAAADVVLQKHRKPNVSAIEKHVEIELPKQLVKKEPNEVEDGEIVEIKQEEEEVIFIKEEIKEQKQSNIECIRSGQLQASTLFVIKEKWNFNNPIGVAQLINNQIVVADTRVNRLVLFDEKGQHIREFNGRVCLRRPSAIAVLGDGRFVVRDDCCLTAFDEACNSLRQIGARCLKRPYGVCLDGQGNCITVDCPTNCDSFFIMRFNFDSGELISRVRAEGVIESSKTGLSKPRFIAFKPPSTLYVVDLGLNCVYIVNADTGRLISRFGQSGKGPGEFNDPAGIALDSEGVALIADSRNHRIQMFTSDGEYLNTLKTDRKLMRPSGLCLTQDGSLMVLNYWEQSLVKFKFFIE